MDLSRLCVFELVTFVGVFNNSFQQAVNTIESETFPGKQLLRALLPGTTVSWRYSNEEGGCIIAFAVM